MDNTALFTAALQLEYPWLVTNVEFLPDEDNKNKMTLHITIGFEKGAKFILLFKAWVMEFTKHMPVAAVARLIDINDKRLWRIIR